jgi:hypothetical protein
VLFIGEVTGLAAAAASGPAPFVWLLAAHVVNLSLILAITWRRQWAAIAIGAAAVAWLVVVEWQTSHDLAVEWPNLLIFAGALYAVFVVYPLVVGRPGVKTKDRWLAAIVASALAFFAGRAAPRPAARLDRRRRRSSKGRMVKLLATPRIETPGERDPPARAVMAPRCVRHRRDPAATEHQ